MNMSEINNEQKNHEKSCRHSMTGCNTIPITGIITENKSEPSVQNFLPLHWTQKMCRKFQIQPLQLNVDFSMTLIVSCLKNCICETVNDYLEKSKLCMYCRELLANSQTLQECEKLLDDWYIVLQSIYVTK